MAEDFNTRVIREFRENAGRVGPPFEGAPMILVHHRGRRTGAEFVAPLVLRFEPVRIESWVTRIRGASFTMAYEILDELPDGQLSPATTLSAWR